MYDRNFVLLLMREYQAKMAFTKTGPQALQLHSPQTSLHKDTALLRHVSSLSCKATVHVSVAENWRNKIRNRFQQQDTFGDQHKAVYRV